MVPRRALAGRGGSAGPAGPLAGMPSVSAGPPQCHEPRRFRLEIGADRGHERRLWARTAPEVGALGFGQVVAGRSWHARLRVQDNDVCTVLAHVLLAHILQASRHILSPLAGLCMACNVQGPEAPAAASLDASEQLLHIILLLYIMLSCLYIAACYEDSMTHQATRSRMLANRCAHSVVTSALSSADAGAVNTNFADRFSSETTCSKYRAVGTE